MSQNKITNENLTQVANAPKLGTGLHVPGHEDKESGEQRAQQMLLAHERVRSVQDYKGSSEIFLTQLLEIESLIVRVSLFEFDPNGERLTPLASQCRGQNREFHINRHLFRDVIRTRKAIVHQLPRYFKTILVLPIDVSRRQTMLLHVEFDRLDELGLQKPMRAIENFSHLCVGHICSLSLLSSMDDWVLRMVETINAAVEAKDTYTSGHSQRVATYAMAIAEAMNMSAQTKRILYLGSICHDIGKIGVPDDILKKPGFLTTEEFEEMKGHPMIGFSIIEATPNAHEISDAIKYHHEKWDGTGYPEGLSGEQIPMMARVVAVADAFDAMTSGRTYSGYMQGDEAVASLKEKSDLFDPNVLLAFGEASANGWLTIRTGTQVGIK